VEEQIILLDTSVLIDFFRKTDKSKSYLYTLSKISESFVVSSVTHYEIYTGVNSESQKSIWDQFFNGVDIIPFDVKASGIAADIDIQLKKARKQIDSSDIFIAATAISLNIPCATLNKKHFSRIANLQLID